MTDSLRRRCDLAIANKAALRREFKQLDLFALTLGADLCAADNLVVDDKKINLCRRIVKQNTNVFSVYRSFCSHFFTVLLSFEIEPQEMMQRTLEAYRALRRYFPRSYQLSFAAYYLAKFSSRPVSELSSRTNAIYKLMRSTVPRDTDSRDIIWAAMWALDGRYSADIAKVVTNAALQLDGVLPKVRKRRLLHNIAVCDKDFEHIGRRVVSLSALLADQKYKYGKRFEQNLLAILAMIDVPEETLATDIIETFEYFKKNANFSRFMSRRELLVHAVIAVTNEYTVSDISDVDQAQRDAMQRLNTAFCFAVGATLSEYGTAIYDQVY